MEDPKVCCVCKETKPLEAFSFKNKAKGTKHCFCKPCSNKYTRADYQKHKKVRNTKQAERKQALKQFVRDIKSVPCVDCKVQYPYYVMDFDHRVGEIKEFEVNIGLKRNMSRKRLLSEIVKCDIVCANCHRERTHRRVTGLET